MVPSVYFNFCLLVSSVSNFRPDTRGHWWSLFWLTCSVVLWGGRNTENKYHWCVWGMLAVSGPHWVALAHSVCVFPVYTVQALGCSAGNCLRWAPRLHVLSRSKPLRFRFLGTPQRHRLGWACVLCPSQVRAAQVIRCLASSVAPNWGLRLITSPSQLLGILGVQLARLLRCAVCLFREADLWLRPSRWMSTIQNPKKCWLARKPACSLVDDASLGPRALAVLACLSQAGDGPVCSWLALLSPLFCEWAWRCLRLGLFKG